MESFCGSPFWDSNRTWYTNNPQFTPCFEKTLLVWLPSAFLSLFSMAQIYFAMKLQRGKIPISLLGLLQGSLTCILIILQIIDFSFTFEKTDATWELLYPADQAQPATKAVTFALALFLQMFTKRKGIQSSAVLFIFWLFVATCSLPEFTSELHRLPLENDYNHRKIHALTTLICYPAIVVEFILNCFADRPPVSSLQGNQSAKQAESEENRPCPQKSSSVLNQWTFQWMYPLLWKGYRGTLNFSDLWDLNEEDNTSTVTKRFMKYWKPEMEMAKEWNSTIKNETKELSCKRGKHSKGTVMINKVKKKTASILPALWKSNWSCIVVSGVLVLIHSLLSFVSPFMLSSLISHLASDRAEESWKGYLYVGTMLVQGLIQNIFFNWHAYLVLLTGIHFRSALTEALYWKSLVVSNKSRKDSKLGEIVNLMSVDTQRFQDFMQYSHQMWVAPLKIGLALYFLWGYLGLATISGVVFMVILVPVHAKITEWIRNLRAEQVKKQDERIRLTSEILSGIKALKLYAWEPPFQDRVESIRQMELDILRRLACINALGNFLSFMSPVLVSIASFATFVLMDNSNVLDPETTFVSLSLFNIMRLPFGFLPLIIGQLVQVQVSLKRINKFMNSDEINPEAVSHDYPEHEMLVSVTDGKFSWDETMSIPTLQNINLNVKKGSLIAVVGNVGSGKSSLLSAILGDMEIQSGRVNTFGSIAYVSQKAWIQNATLRDNILFGREFDPILYDRIVESCALKPDIRIFPGGDLTEIGERGINLSGGQKQRVALARAVYNDADIYLLDDPLSAVDSHVGKQLFQEVIGPEGMLKEKTRIVVTHGMTFLPHVDFIVGMNNGEIIESGKYKEIVMRKTAFADFLVQHDGVEDAKTRCGSKKHGLEAMTISGRNFCRNLLLVPFNGTKATLKPSVVRGGTTNTSDTLSIINQKNSTDKGINCSVKNVSEDEAEMNPSKLIGVERMEIGNVKAQVYGYFVKVMGVAFVVTSLVSFTIGHGVNIYSNFWLSNWSTVPTKNGIQDMEKRNMYLTVYCALGVIQSIAMYLANITLLFGFLHASAVLHKSMLSRVLRAPMSFFDATPTGRIINRFSKDMDVLDTSIGQMVYQSISSLYHVLSVLIVISINMPIFLTVVTPITVIYIGIQRFYAATSRQLRRLGSISRSPVFTHFGETLAGLSTIRAFNVQRQFVKELERKLDMDLMTSFLFICTNRWIAFVLECIGNLIVMFAGMFTLLYHIDGGKTGLSISYALSITVYLNFLIKQTLEVETNTVAIERMKEYCDIPQEAAWYVASQNPGTEWPQHGNIIFREFQTRYRHNLDLVLRKVDCNISRGEKVDIDIEVFLLVTTKSRIQVGIVGRTGSGKSSLTLSLFRILEASQGAILIDGEDISKMGLQDIRGRLTIIPQDPVLFVGSLRLNLDPSGKHSDDTIWQSLEHAHLKDFVASLPEGLNAIVEEGGKNFSVGQTQLVCLARALLRNTKILILDEATAAVDMQTDDLIQQTIRSEFKDCTILTVAHRLNTIMDSDRVMVLDNGEIQEFDSPYNLMSNKKSIFYGMVKEAGVV